jgi:hypothetical protein
MIKIKLIDKFFIIIKNIIANFFKETNKEKSPTDDVLDNNISTLKQYVKSIEPLIEYIVKEKIKRFFKYRWKSFLFKLIMISGVLLLLYFAIFRVVEPIFITVPEKKTKTEIVKTYPSDSSMTLENFMIQIQYVESRYNPEARRSGSQYWGLYQLGMDARKNSGYGDISYDVFKNHPEIQHLCMIQCLKIYKNEMKDYIQKYDGEIIDGVLITESGILAMSHIGIGSAKKYLDSGKIPIVNEQHNSPREYAKLGGYKLDFDKYNFEKIKIKK